MNLNEKTFHVNPKKVWNHFIGFIIVFLGFIMFIWGVISSKGPFVVDLILLLFALLCLFYSVYILTFLITAKLIISDYGVSYSQPMYSVSCEWKYIRVQYLKGILYFQIDEKFAKTHFRTIEKILINQQNIWLNYFVDRFDKDQYWQKDPVLVELQKHMPFLTDAAKEHFRSN